MGASCVLTDALLCIWLGVVLRRGWLVLVVRLVLFYCCYDWCWDWGGAFVLSRVPRLGFALETAEERESSGLSPILHRTWLAPPFW